MISTSSKKLSVFVLMMSFLPQYSCFRIPISKRYHKYFLSSSTDLLNLESKLDVASTDENHQLIQERSTKVKQKSLPISVYIDYELRKALNMKNHERKGKIFIKPKADNMSIKYLKDIIENQHIALTGIPYSLRYYIPSHMNFSRKFLNDNEVVDVFSASTEQLSSTDKTLIQLFVDHIPGVFPPPEHDYLVNMSDPMDSKTMTLLSFYRFLPLTELENVSFNLQYLWKPFQVHGRVYLAEEGINAQMAVPTNVLSNFRAACQTYPLTAGLLLNTDHEMSREDYEKSQPFDNLHIRIRHQIVADGFPDPLDWTKSGREMSPLEWHDQLSNPSSIILDCRNSYESDVGIFENAIPLNTTFFRESWDALEEVLKDVPKDAPLMTYCTGGIRCVKINAFLEQKLGFQNVSRLAGGIISYTRELDALSQDTTTSTTTTTSNNDQESVNAPHLTRHISSSKFHGVNYVFDERMAARITSEVLTACETCGQPSDSFLNCYDYQCHVRFIQCPACRTSYNGCCSKACQNRYEKSPQFTTKIKQNNIRSKLLLPRLLANNQKLDTTTGTTSTTSSITSTTDATSSNIEPVAPRQSIMEEINSITFNNNERTATSSSTTNVQQNDNIDEEFEIIKPAKVQQVVPPVISRIEEKEVLSELTRQQQQQRQKHSLSSLDGQLEALSEYCYRQSAQEPDHLTKLRETTASVFPSGSHMISGPLQGRLLSLLVAASKSKRVLELGTFTGYSALCMAEGLSDDVGSAVITCEQDERSLKLAETQFRHAPEKLRNKITTRLGKASEALSQFRKEQKTFDFVFIDADKKAYISYLNQLIGFSSIPEASTATDATISTNDQENTEGATATTSDVSLLVDGALVVVDNVLWKGLVLTQEEDLATYAPNPQYYGNETRMLNLARTMHAFSSHVANSKHFKAVMLPLRDGLSILQYSKNGFEKQ